MDISKDLEKITGDDKCKLILFEAGRLDDMLSFEKDPSCNANQTVCAFESDNKWFFSAYFWGFENNIDNGFTLYSLPKNKYTYDSANTLFMGISKAMGTEDISFKLVRAQSREQN